VGAGVATAGFLVLLGAGASLLSSESVYLPYILGVIVGVTAGMLTLGAAVVAQRERSPGAAASLARAGGLVAIGVVIIFLITVTMALVGGGEQTFAAVLFGLLGVVLAGLVAMLASQTHSESRASRPSASRPPEGDTTS